MNMSDVQEHGLTQVYEVVTYATACSRALNAACQSLPPSTRFELRANAMPSMFDTPAHIRSVAWYSNSLLADIEEWEPFFHRRVESLRPEDWHESYYLVARLVTPESLSNGD